MDQTVHLGLLSVHTRDFSHNPADKPPAMPHYAISFHREPHSSFTGGQEI